MANAFALSGTNLLAFDTATSSLVTTIGITGINAGETLVGIDFRPQNGFLYALGVNASANTATLYSISPTRGVAGIVGGAPSQIFLTPDGVTLVDLPDPATTGWGFDFNPAADRIRVTAGSLNFRINPNTGTAVDGDMVTSGTQPDTPINSGTTSVDATAYTNNQPNNPNVTTLYTLDAASNQLFIQNPANAGIQTLGQTVTLGGNTLDFTTINGFDIPAGVNAASNGAAVTSGSAFAALNVGGTTSLYSINLVNAQATLVGNIGNGTTAVQGLAIHSDLGGLPAIGLSSDGLSLIHFNTATPGTTTTVPITSGIVAGETLVAIDYRPATGQLYAVGINAAANSGNLYLVDPATASVLAFAVFAFSFTTDGVTLVDLPDPATVGYGMDFNPATDRIRVTTSTGLNFRLNPDTGAPVDGNNGGSSAVTGTNPDGTINGSGSTGISATAYTDSYGAALQTTQYTLDAASDTLFIQNLPNTGTQILPLPTQLAGLALGAPTSNFTINSSGGGDTANISLGENATAVVTVTTTQNHPYYFANDFSIIGGADAAKFTINPSTGALRFANFASPDFENPTDVGANNTYIVQVRASDGAFFDTQTITVTITNVNDVTPTITSNGGGATANISIAENNAAVTTVVATDGDGPAITYSLNGGADAARFQIDASTGALSFLSAPDFEAPTDADANNSYIVNVRASDGSLFDDQAITVQVTNVAEAVRWTASVDLGSHTPGWLPSGIGDFNNDGTSDIAWVNPTTNNIDIWLINNGQWAASFDVGSHPAGAAAVGVGNFDLNGVADIAWRDTTTGQIDNWLLAFS